MKSLCISFFILLGIAAFAQDSRKNDNAISYEVGLNLTNVLSSFLSIDNEQLDADPYSVGFKIKKGKNVFRTSASLVLKNSLENDAIINGQRSLKDNVFGLKLGYEKRMRISDRFSGFFGFDMLGEYRIEESEFVPNFGERVEDVQEQIVFGGGPVLGIMFHINKKLSLGTESTLYFIYGKEDSETKFLPSGEIFSKDQSTFIGLNHMLPQSLYFIFHF